jgi:hypothetical protein
LPLRLLGWRKVWINHGASLGLMFALESTGTYPTPAANGLLNTAQYPVSRKGTAADSRGEIPACPPTLVLGTPISTSKRMHLASDYIHPTPRGGRCRVRVYLPEEERDAPVVIRSELPTNEGSSITYVAEQLAAEVIRYHRLAVPVVWIEHHQPLSTDGDTETFDLVDFSSYEVMESAPYMGETRLRVGEATWKRITRSMVEVLVGGEV